MEAERKHCVTWEWFAGKRGWLPIRASYGWSIDYWRKWLKSEGFKIRKQMVKNNGSYTQAPHNSLSRLLVESHFSKRSEVSRLEF